MKASAAHQRGVSLIEALVALAVMAFGMLGVVGVQSTLRFNADVSRQRTEAVRLAQQWIENSRTFTAVVANPDVFDYSDITDVSQAISGYSSNTAYTVTNAVAASGDTRASDQPRMKTLRVTVSWTDRTAAYQSVEFNTAVARIMPELGGTLLLARAVNASGISTRVPMPNGRALAIPQSAVNLGNGSSAFMPPQAAGGNVVWVLDNTTALIAACTTTASSTSAVTLASISSCWGKLQLLSGYVDFGAANYATLSTAQKVAEALNPSGTALAATVAVNQTVPTTGTVNCFVATPQTDVASLAYYCAVPVSSASTPTLSWSGTSVVGGLAGAPTVCRYTTTTSPVPNSQHPLTYALVNTPLAQQNFLVLPWGSACPGVISGAITTVSP